MSNSDSFIDEVTEEVRKEKLYGYLRRYGWIGVVTVLAIVGGAAWSEYRAAQATSAAQQTGDALLDALNQDDVSARATAVADVTAEGPAAAVAALLIAAAQQEAGNADAARQSLEAVATDMAAPEIYREIASFKAALLESDDPEQRMLSLQQLSQPGQPFRLLALEQIAYTQLETGETEAAVATLRSIQEDAALTGGLRERVETLLIALGDPLPTAATQ